MNVLSVDRRILVFIRFLITGGLATLIQFILLWFFVSTLQLNQTFSSAMAFSISAVFNYILSYYFTFSAASPHGRALFKFCIMVVLGLLINTSCFHLFNILLSGQYLIAQAMSTVLLIIWNFNLSRKWIFK
jgi:putative flippase GtrA